MYTLRDRVKLKKKKDGTCIIFRWPPPPSPFLVHFFFFFTNFFIAYLASVSHDQDFKLNLFFSHWKVHQYLEKFAKNHYLISGGNFLSPRQARPPPHNWKNNFMCSFCVSECPGNFWCWREKYGTFWVSAPSSPPFHTCTIFFLSFFTSSLAASLIMTSRCVDRT